MAVRARRLVRTGIIGALLLLSLQAPLPIQADTGAPPRPGGYHVSGNLILDPTGARFIIKGADVVYGRFAGGDVYGYGYRNYQNAQRDLDNLLAQHVNTVRVMISYSEYATGPLGSTEYMRELDQVVAWATQRGMVTELSQGYSGFSQAVVDFDAMLADRYQTNPKVWIKPDNEPNCHGDMSKCGDWSYWQSTERQFVQAIRDAGNTQPIVVNCIWWSWVCSEIGSYPLGDSNIIYGAHRYGNGTTTFDASQAASSNAFWANLSSTYAVIVDEVGLSVPPLSPPDWGAGFLDFTTDWVQTRGGGGVIGFTDSWSDPNSLTNPDGSWNAWGQTFIAHSWSK
jgi:Cellulase (glycosyl hydrolase family 5)